MYHNNLFRVPHMLRSNLNYMVKEIAGWKLYLLFLKVHKILRKIH